jgi:hypothetical protein
VGERCVILPHDGLSPRFPTIAIQRHPVQSEREGRFPRWISLLPKQDDLSSPSLLRLLFLLSSPPPFPPDYTIEVLSLHFPELVLAKNESPLAVFENPLPRSLISLDLFLSPKSTRDRREYNNCRIDGGHRN